MIWILLAVGVAVVLAHYLLFRAIYDSIDMVDKLRRNDARLAAERWEVLQERHDAIIELIAQIAEAKAPEIKGAPKPRRKAK